MPVSLMNIDQHLGARVLGNVPKRLWRSHVNLSVETMFVAEIASNTLKLLKVNHYKNAIDMSSDTKKKLNRSQSQL